MERTHKRVSRQDNMSGSLPRSPQASRDELTSVPLVGRAAAVYVVLSDIRSVAPSRAHHFARVMPVVYLVVSLRARIVHSHLIEELSAKMETRRRCRCSPLCLHHSHPLRF